MYVFFAYLIRDRVERKGQTTEIEDYIFRLRVGLLTTN